MSVRILAAVLVGLLAACSPTVPVGSDLSATVQPPRLILFNPGERAIYFNALEESTAARTLWGPCDQPATCDRVEPRQQRALQLSDVAGYSSEAQVIIVYWWYLEPDGRGGFVPDRLRALRVHL